jgi:glutathione synthase/RimK-type ligase-like ATP-grasp enzyme
VDPQIHGSVTLKMTLILLATSESVPNLTKDDQSLIAPLAKRGIEARPAVWSDPRVNWTDADAVLIRSCWDYHLRLKEFLVWINALERAKVKIWNPPATLRWNTNKIYLRQLEEKGVPIVPTLWPEAGFNLRQELQQRDWKQAVVKPRVSATAYRTLLTSPDTIDAAQTLIDDLLRGPGSVVQEFLEEVRSQGEWSLIFFSGQFSHAVIKTPRAGDFRVQHDFGGREKIAHAPDSVIQAASHAIAATAGTPLYARVDGVESSGQFLLMELELIEPALFLELSHGAAERFAAAIARICP